MNPCKQHPGPVLGYFVLVLLTDSTVREDGPFLEFAMADAHGQLALDEPDALAYLLQTRLVERGTT